jgi:hypothetical protein
MRGWVCNLLLLQGLASAVPWDLRPYFIIPIFETPTCRVRSPYLYPPGTGWPSYTLGHWVPFFDFWPQAALGWTPQKTHLLAVALLRCDVAIVADRRDSTTCNSSSVVACVSVAAVTWHPLIRCLATAVCAGFTIFIEMLWLVTKGHWPIPRLTIRPGLARTVLVF